VPEKIYITRRKASRRKIINEVDIIDVVESLDFIVMDCDDRSVRDQVNIFSKAKILCSIHGAGLANMLFMQPDSKILEIRSPITETGAACFWHLSNSISHHYYYIIGKPFGAPNEHRPIDFSMYVDPSALYQALLAITPF
jgi:capsular polysaccharide biosynthesis protein